MTVASKSLKPGDVALRIPDTLVVTLDRIFEDGGVAELLTTNKLSELVGFVCLWSVLMWHCFML